MKVLLAIALLICSTAVSAATPACSIHAHTDTPAAQLDALAKLSCEQARTRALAAAHVRSKTTGAEGELKVERGCLIYSFDVPVPKKSGVEEIAIDAGNGKVLWRKHESPSQEALEQARKAASDKPQ